MKPTAKPSDAVAMHSETPQILPEKPGEPGGEKALREEIGLLLKMAEECDARGEVKSPQGGWTFYQGKIEAYRHVLGALAAYEAHTEVCDKGAGALAACAREAKLEEALWWEHLVGDCHGTVLASECIYCERILKLRQDIELAGRLERAADGKA